jgi:hypothetical protein
MGIEIPRRLSRGLAIKTRKAQSLDRELDSEPGLRDNKGGSDFHVKPLFFFGLKDWNGSQAENLQQAS